MPNPNRVKSFFFVLNFAAAAAGGWVAFIPIWFFETFRFLLKTIKFLDSYCQNDF